MNQRTLSFIEMYCKIANDLNQSYNLIAVSQFHCSELNEPMIHECFSQLINEFPALRATIKINDRQIPCFSLQAQTTSDHIKTADAAQISLSEAVSGLINHPFTDDLLWRALIVINKESNRHYLVLSLHHVIADGLSVIKIINQFLNHIYKSPLKHERAIDVPASAETRFVHKTSVLRFLLSLLCKKMIGYERLFYHVPFERNNTGASTTQYFFKTYEPEVLNKVLAFAKHHQLSFTAVLHGCLLNAIAKVFRMQKKRRVLSAIPLSAPDIRQSSAEVGFLSIPLAVSNQISCDRTILDTAYETRHELAKKLNKACELPYNFIPNVTWQNRFRTSICTHKAFQYVCQLSNLGVVDDLIERKQDLLEFYFFTTRNHVDVMMSLYTATLSGTLYLTFAYDRSLLNSDKANCIIEYVDQNLRTLISRTW